MSLRGVFDEAIFICPRHALYTLQRTKRYNVNKFVYYELFDDIKEAIAREKQIKGGSRQKKVDLIDRFNPSWRDLSDDL